MYQVAVGFSVNPELVVEYDSNQPPPNVKLKMLGMRCDLSGTSADVAIALSNMGKSVKLYGLTGSEYSEADCLLDYVLGRASIPLQRIPILHKTSIAFLRADRSSNEKGMGVRGEMDQKLLAVYMKENPIHLSTDILRVATGVRDSELVLVEQFFNGGVTILNPNVELIRNRMVFLEILQKTNILIMNQEELHLFDESTLLEDMHRYGPRIVIVTMADQGGMFSVDGEVKNFEAVPCQSSNIYSQGAGDWFLGGLITAVLDVELDILQCFADDLAPCIRFAAKVASKKITMPGAANGPHREDL